MRNVDGFGQGDTGSLGRLLAAFTGRADLVKQYFELTGRLVAGKPFRSQGASENMNMRLASHACIKSREFIAFVLRATSLSLEGISFAFMVRSMEPQHDANRSKLMNLLHSFGNAHF